MAQFGLYNHPELSWETIETEHFKIHYHSGEYRTPRLIAKILEEIYDPVTDARRKFKVRVKQTRNSLRVYVD